MDFDLVRPLISGIIGALLASWLFRKLARYAPSSDPAFDAEETLRRSSLRQRGALCLAVVPIALVIYLYKSGVIQNNDWRGLAAAFGTAVLLPYLFLVLTSLGRGSPSAREIILAQAIQSRTPLWVHYGALVLGVFCLILAIAHWLQKG